MTLTSEQLLALLPLLITGGTAILVMLAIAVRRNHFWNATLTVVGLNLALASVAWLAWRGLPQPIQVTPLLVVDGYSLFYMGLVIATTLACATLCHAYMEGYPANREELYLLLVLACTGGVVLACSRHLASLFIGLELLSVPVYGMIAYAYRERHSLEGGIKYMVLSAAASATLLFGMALLYAQAGTLSFDGLGASLANEGTHGGVQDAFVLAGVAMLLAGLAFKLSLVPFHLWTPDVYQGAPAPVGAFLATTSKTAVFAVLLRLYATAPATAHQGLLPELLAGMAIASILIGNLLALTQTNLKRLLGYSSISHFGYILIAVAAGKAISVEAVGAYLLTYVVTTLAAFGVVALMSSPYQGSDADAIYDYRGLFWRRPYLTMVMTVAMLSLAGIPLTAGFIGKFYIVAAGVSAELWWSLAALIIGSAIGLYYYLRVMVTLFLATPGMRRYDAPLLWGQQVGGIMVMLLIGLMLFLGVYPQPALHLIQLAGISAP
jgi:NADH-quinone oxidoreductase subunit N